MVEEILRVNKVTEDHFYYQNHSGCITHSFDYYLYDITFSYKEATESMELKWTMWICPISITIISFISWEKEVKSNQDILQKVQQRQSKIGTDYKRKTTKGYMPLEAILFVSQELCSSITRKYVYNVHQGLRIKLSSNKNVEAHISLLPRKNFI